MILKLLSAVILVHVTSSEPQFGGLGGLLGGTPNRGGASNSGGLGSLPGAGLLPGVLGDGLSIPIPTGQQLQIGLNGIKLGFGDYKSVFKKTYIDKIEEAARQKIFSQVTQSILDHNKLFEEGLVKFSMAINQFSDWTFDEYKEILGFDNSQATNAGSRRRRQTKASATCESPEEKDWREEGAVTPIKDQMKCASCWAFSATAALEGQFFRENGKLNSLSEQQFLDCSKDLGNKGCNKGLMSNAFKYAQSIGIATDKDYPYEAKDSSCRAPAKSDLKIKGFETIPKGDEAKLLDTVCRIGPVAAAIDATSEKFKQYSDGVYFNSDCDPNNISHAILIVGYGYDETTDLDYWIIKNSFGTTWGKDGYGKVARNMDNHCGIANAAAYPVV